MLEQLQEVEIDQTKKRTYIQVLQDKAMQIISIEELIVMKRHKLQVIDL